uniref:Transmembrane protein n=2 Tax=Macrostomum lignano TaxID=282301 RepID=A0A1I8J3R9_9PLAT
MFLNASAATALTAVRSDSGCVLKTEKLENITVTESNRAVVQFGDCSSPMLSLLSFPETSRSVPSSAAHCSGSEVATLLDRLQSRFADAESSPEFSAQRTNHSAMEGNESFFQKNQAFIYPAIIVGALLLIAVFVLLAFAMKRRRRRRSQLKESNPESVVFHLPGFRRSVSTRSDRDEVTDRGTSAGALWDIKLKTSNPGTQLVIAAVPSKNNRSTADGEVEMSVEFLNSNSISVTTGMFQVLQRQSSDRRFTVEVSWDPRRQAPSSENLRILLPIPGKCGRDMLQFNGSCYAVSAVRQSMTDATDSVGGDAQLASFSSMAEISEFISANTARQDKLPYRRPLGLKQPVRLGMFHNASAAAVLSAVRSDSGCLLQLVSNSFNFSVTDEDSAVVEFVNCSSPMLSLLSFPETARSAPNSTAHCSGSELMKLVQLKLSYQVSTTLSPSQIHSRRTRIAVFSSVGLGVPLLIGVLVGLACVLYRRQRSFDIRGNNPEGDQQQDPARAVSAISDNNPILYAFGERCLVQTNSANHYCVNRHTLRLEMDDFHHRDETIIPWLPDETEHSRLLELNRCRWNVKLKSPKPSQQQVVLEGVPSSGGMEEWRSSTLANQTEIPLEILGISAHASQAVGVGTLRLKKLRIAMPLPRVCSRGMLNYNGKCYALSTVGQNLTAAMSSIRGDAQLASFSSMSEISEFVFA